MPSLRLSRHLVQQLPYGEFFLMGSRTEKGHAVSGVTPFRLSIKAWSSEVRAVYPVVETFLCEDLAEQPPLWPPASR